MSYEYDVLWHSATCAITWGQRVVPCSLDQALLREEWLHLFDIVVAMECGSTE
jgi:hypothetical protein